MISELEFKSLSTQGYNRIPLMAEAFADLETPLSLYLKLAYSTQAGKHSFLLESVVGGERFGRYSFIGLPARTLVRAGGFGADAVTEVVTDGVVVETSQVNPLDFIAEYQKRFKVALRPGLPRFCGGLAGYFGYDAVRYIEKKLEKSCPPDSLGCPDILLLQCEELAVIDNLSGKLYLIVYADPRTPEAYANAKKRLRELKEKLKYSVSAPTVKPTQSYPAERDFAKADYIAAVERAKALIADGDFMQVQVGQRIKKRFTESPLSLYRALRSLNPSPYMYYYHFGDFHVVGASPEILVRQEQVEAVAPGRPKQGTAPSGGSAAHEVTSVGAISAAPLGNAAVLPISWMYCRMMGAEGLQQATEVAILSANYISARLVDHYPTLYASENGHVAHECILDLRPLKDTTGGASGISAEDVAKRLMDYGFHAPTLSFPVPGTLMVEPTESETLDELDRFIHAMISIREEIRKVENGIWPQDNNPLKHAPHTAASLLDEAWDRPYTRELGAFPLASLKHNKYWPPVGRVDNVYGDRNLFCSCVPISDYAQ